MAICVYTLYVPNPVLVPKPFLRMIPHQIIKRYVKKELNEIQGILKTMENNKTDDIRSSNPHLRKIDKGNLS